MTRLLDELAAGSILMSVEGEFRLQTRGSAEWQSDFTRRFGSIRNDATRIAGDRSAALRQAVGKALKGIELDPGPLQDAARF